jgi:DNA-binding transcriptional ArsR family regulator
MNMQTNENNLNINVIEVKKAAMVLRAINHKLRQQIVQLIHTAGKITVTEIYVKLRLEQSVASQHLAILRKSGFLNTERDGKFIYYTVNYPRFDEVDAFTKQLLHSSNNNLAVSEVMAN